MDPQEVRSRYSISAGRGLIKSLSSSEEKQNLLVLKHRLFTDLAAARVEARDFVRETMKGEIPLDVDQLAKAWLINSACRSLSLCRRLRY